VGELDLVPYSWTQTLAEVNLSVPVPEGKTGKQFELKIEKKSLSLRLKGSEEYIFKVSITITPFARPHTSRRESFTGPSSQMTPSGAKMAM
jgi:hypothetical protein